MGGCVWVDRWVGVCVCVCIVSACAVKLLVPVTSEMHQLAIMVVLSSVQFIYITGT